MSVRSGAGRVAQFIKGVGRGVVSLLVHRIVEYNGVGRVIPTGCNAREGGGLYLGLFGVLVEVATHKDSNQTL